MRLAGAAVRRIWTGELRPQPGGCALVCVRCHAHTPLPAASARSAALEHLACHARGDALPAHLRTCQCRTQGCPWHPRHRGCAGPVRLALTRDRGGRVWRLADACGACAAATGDTAVVPDTLLAALPPAAPPAAAAREPRRPDGDERRRVREMLTYLATALPRSASPAARLLALQCALRASADRLVRMPAGLLRGMRLHGRSDVWDELAEGHWLRAPDLRSAPVQVQVLDYAIRDQTPGRAARRRAAHWALGPCPLDVRRDMSSTTNGWWRSPSRRTCPPAPRTPLAWRRSAACAATPPTRPRSCWTGWSLRADWRSGARESSAR
ncbi:hypothetical protein ABZV65_32070 [Streptomyces bauhiniae]|uniref:hypothetical protein n=1 Tax=Streptomyces bauhiniae TaxID=2340725 RepID=UPI0033B27B5A